MKLNLRCRAVVDRRLNPAKAESPDSFEHFQFLSVRTRKMSENSIDDPYRRVNPLVIACLIILPFVAVAGCRKSTPKAEPAEDTRPPVVQDMNIVQPDSSN